MNLNEIKLSPEEMARYSRHIAIPEFSVEGQKRLKAAKVLVIGSGGLGSPVLLYLAAAGVGHIGIVDFDVVDDTNLQRQVLFTVDDIGKSKAETAKVRLLKLNPYINITVYNTAFTTENALDIIKDYDVVADGTDNFPTRYLVNDACVLAGKINVYASIFRFEGQVSVFNYPQEDGTRSANYRDLFPEPPPPGLVPNCSEGGVLGVLPGIIGSMQASEVIKVVTGVGEPLNGRLFLFDAASFTTRVLKVGKNPDTKITALINYEQFCGIGQQEETPLKEVSVQDLKSLIDGNSEFQLIDVREPYENDISSLNGELIPLAQVVSAKDKISRDKKVVIYCRSGKRSADAIRELETLYHFDNLYNLTGGINAFAKEVDETMKVY
ncbi:MAG: molybdopterin/thiamine biosynthesis adenylyltransferase/rhodanese-related sulfurtransferase [Saprospiraceae bacterium]|jgi:molybdopterin/thiamine biosynthesis adenylyltransferase/rhodanese-related sulfurtransferase